ALLTFVADQRQLVQRGLGGRRIAGFQLVLDRLDQGFLGEGLFIVLRFGHGAILEWRWVFFVQLAQGAAAVVGSIGLDIANPSAGGLAVGIDAKAWALGGGHRRSPDVHACSLPWSERQ